VRQCDGLLRIEDNRGDGHDLGVLGERGHHQRLLAALAAQRFQRAVIFRGRRHLAADLQRPAAAGVQVGQALVLAAIGQQQLDGARIVGNGFAIGVNLGRRAWTK
jgi:hypothetical protein